MNTRKQIGTTESLVIPAIGQSLVKSATPLKQAIQDFLQAKAPFLGNDYRCAVHYVLEERLSALSHLPIGAITTPQLHEVVFGCGLHPRAQKSYALALRKFFTWCRSHGYLPAGRPTPADPLRVQVPKLIPAVLKPSELRTWLAGTKKVEDLLSIVLPAFAGIRHDEMTRLCWHRITPGKSIYLGPETGLKFGRRLPILPVLDAWLRPFYGSQEKIISSWEVGCRIHRLAHRLGVPDTRNCLRHSYCTYRLAQTGNASKTASEAGLSPNMLPHFAQPVTDAAVEEFFSLTPEAVGFQNWPAIVAEYLVERRTAPAPKPRGQHFFWRPIPAKSKSAEASPPMSNQPNSGATKKGSGAA